MSRSTILITRTDGLKVRTTAGKRFYVTIPGSKEGSAKVITRTDDVSSAYRNAKRWGSGVQVWDSHPSRARFVTLQELGASHETVLQRKRAATRLARQGNARSLWY